MANTHKKSAVLRTVRTSVWQRGAGPSVGAGVARTSLDRSERAAWSHVDDVLQHSMGPASFGVERQLLAIQRDGFQAATEPVGDGQVAPVASRGVLAYVTAKVNAVVKVEGAQSSWRCARGGVHPVQHQLCVVAVHLQRDGVPLPVIDLSTVNRHEAWPAAAVKLVLQTSVHNLIQRQTEAFRK